MALKLETIQKRRKLYLSGLTLAQVGALEGITWQAVDLCLKRHYPTLKRRSKGKPRVPRTKISCAFCEKSITTTVNENKKFCSKKCRARFNSPKPSHIKFGTKAYDEWRLDHRKYTSRVRTRMLYHNVYKHRPDWKEYMSIKNKSYRDSVKEKVHAENT